MKKRTMIGIALAFSFACSCSEFKSGNVAELTITFADPKWDGEKIPKSGQCQNCGGEGFSPALMVKNIPSSADVIIAKFYDRNMGVFHGAVRFRISQKSEFVIPSIPEQTFELPQGAEIESAHNAPVGKDGAYMAPCGCGSGNLYEANILAIKAERSGEKLLLGKGTIYLGRF